MPSLPRGRKMFSLPSLPREMSAKTITPEHAVVSENLCFQCFFMFELCPSLHTHPPRFKDVVLPSSPPVTNFRRIVTGPEYRRLRQKKRPRKRVLQALYNFLWRQNPNLRESQTVQYRGDSYLRKSDLSGPHDGVTDLLKSFCTPRVIFFRGVVSRASW